MSAENRKRLKIGLAVAAVMAGLAIAVTALNSGRTPEAAARAYVDLLAAGRADEATALVDPGVHNEQRALLTDAAMQGRGEMKIESVTQADDQTDDRVRVRVDYLVEGQRYNADLNVERQPNSWLFLNNWRVTSSLAVPVTIQAQGLNAVKVGDVTVELTSTRSQPNSVELFAYPGQYTVQGDGLSQYLTAEDARLLVGSSWQVQNATARLEAKPNDALEKKVLESVQAAAAKCGSAPGNVGKECPSRVQSTKLAFVELTSAPSEITELSTQSFNSGEGIITIQENPTSWSPNPDKRQVRFTTHGEITFDANGEPTVTVTESFGGW